MSQPSDSDHSDQNPRRDGEYQPGKQEPLEDAFAKPVGEEEARAGARPQAASLEVKRSVFSRAAQRFFGPQTGLGRSLRPLVRAIALAVVIFALGVLAAYWRLVRPLQEQIGPMQQQYNRLQEELKKTQGGLESARQQAVNSDQLAQRAEARLGVEQTYGLLLRAMRSVSDARQAVLDGELEAAGQQIEQAGQLATQIQPQMKALDERQVASLEAILTLTQNDLARDPELAVQDLDRLRVELERMEKNLLASEDELWNCSCNSFRKPPSP